MKWDWANRKHDREAVNRLRGLLLLSLFFGAASARAQTPSDAAAAAGVVANRSAVAAGDNHPGVVPPNVVAVRIITEDGRVLLESPAGLTIEAGKPIDPHQVAESLRALYRSGDYADLRAETTAVEGGVRLDFIARENFFVNQVLILGLTAPPSDASSAAAMQLSLGKTYRRSDVDEALLRLREVLSEEGLYTAAATAETKAHPDTHQMDIIVHVKPGPRAGVGAIDLINGTKYRDTELLSIFKLKSGRPITTARIQRGTDRIRKFLVKRGHLSARAVVRRGDYDPAKNSVPIKLDISEGPRVQVTVTGAKFSSGDLKKLVPIYQEGAVDADLLEEGKRNLRERMERDGYFDANVDYTTDTHEVKASKSGWQGSEEVITYRIKRGERHRLLGIDIAGNHYFDTELLRSRLQVIPGSFAARGRFSRRLLETDAQSMRNLYLSKGFLEAKVEGQALDDYHGKIGDVFIQFAVQEGKQTLVSSLAIEGSHAVSQDELRRVAESAPGKPYSDANVAKDRDNILALYFNRGFPGARFTATSDRVSPERPTSKADNPKQSAAKKENEEKQEKNGKPEIEKAAPIRLVYHIEEGPQTRVRRVFITGYKHTRPGVIRREVSVKPDAPLSEGDVVKSQQHLYNLGIFNRVTIEPQNSAGSDPEKDVVVLVEEAKRYTIAYGGGFEVQRLASTTDPTAGQFQAAPRGILEVSKLNLTGRADTLSLKLRGSTLQGRALLAYATPNTFGDPHLSLQATAYAEKTRDINTFSETRYEGSLQLTDQFTSLSSVLYRYTFRKVLVNNLKILSQEIPLFNQPTLVSQFGVTWFRDSRNNPADASKGSFNSADLSLTDTGIGSSASFLRFFLQNTTYHPIRRGFSFARSVRLGILVPYRDTVSLSFPAPTTLPFPTVIPLPERFFAGGGLSLRGFALNQAGPRDASGFPVGGQALLVLNQEFRFPMRLPFIGTQLGGALFYDGGNVFSRATRITFRSSPPEPVFSLAYPNKQPGPFNPTQCKFNCTNELNYFAHTIGFGIRYATPVGPIRVDLGYQINRPLFVIPCKNRAVLCQQGTQLPRLQIFFNLGSSF